MVIFLRELIRNRKSFITWTASLVSASVLMLMFFPYMDLQMDAFNDMLKLWPESMISVLNLNSMDISKILPYFSYVFQYILLFSAIYAMQFGAGILSREESERTVEFLLAKPIKRSEVVTSKILCLLFYFVLFNIIFIVADYVTIIAITDQSFSMEAFLLLHLGQLLLQLVFAAIGLLISVFVVKSGTIFPLSVGVVLGTYFISIVSGISEKLANLKYITPFEYVIPADIIKATGIEPVYLIIICLVTITAIAGTYVFYNRKDIA